MTQFQQIIEFFRNIQPGEFITRKMYLDTMKNENLTESALDNVRCHLMRAGYIYDGPDKIAGIYYMAKIIPKNINSTQLYEQAYGKKKNHDYSLVHYQLSPDLRDITGLSTGTISQIMNAFWRYVFKNKVQTTYNKRIIKAGNDPQFKAVIGNKNLIHAFDVVKELRKHMIIIGYKEVRRVL